jgi:hypothetical protein
VEKFLFKKIDVSRIRIGIGACDLKGICLWGSISGQWITAFKGKRKLLYILWSTNT